jgi:O-antigen/teichoic acid export membrane protein
MTSVFRSTLEAREDFRSIGIIQSAGGASTYLVPLLLSFVGSDVRTIVGAMVVCRGLALVAYVIRALAWWPNGFPWSRLSLRAHREFREFSFWTIGSNLLGAAIVYGDRALLVRLFGLAEIPFYNVPLEFFGRIMILMNSVATVIFPPLSRLSDNKLLFERAYVAFVTLLSAAAGVILLIVSLATPEVLLHWLGAQFLDNSTHVVRILMVGLQFQCLNVMALASLNARGVSRPIMLMHLAEVPFYFGAMTFFGLRLGLDGIALVWSGRLVAEFICFTLLQLRLLDAGSARPQWVGAVLAAANGIPLVLVAGSVRAAAAVPASILAASLAIAWSLLQLRGAGVGLLSGERA